MRIVSVLLISLSAILFGCQSEPNTQHPGTWEEIAGRTEAATLIYHLKVPLGWTRIDPINRLSLSNTTLPICEFHINEGSDSIRITIHNFPSLEASDRIAPAAQVARWKRQFDPLDQMSVSLIPQAYSGFSGLLFEGTGEIEGQQTSVLAWSMQLAHELYRRLPSENSLNSQKRGDYTIKAQGTKALMTKHHDAIIAFARSFELIDPIPLKS